jgi:hypothetical protein
MANALSGRDLYNAIEELERPFLAGGKGSRSIRDRMEKLQQIEDSIYDYTQHLPQTWRNPISIAASMLRNDRNKGVAGLSNTLRVHNEPRGGLKRQETAADRLEVYESHVILELLEPLRDDIHQKQVMGLAWYGWLEADEWGDVERADKEDDKSYNKRVTAERNGFFPLHIMELNGETVSYMEEEPRVFSMAGVRFKLPIIEIMERFGGIKRDNDADLIHAWNEEFGWMAMDLPQPRDDVRDTWGEMVEVTMIGDKQTVSYCVDRGPKQGRTNANRYKGLGETTYEHHFGQVPLLAAEGVYLYDRPIAYRREGLLQARIELEHAKAIIKSQWATQTASPPEYVENKIPSEVDTRDQPELIDPSGALMRRQSRGEIQLLERKVDATQDKLYGTLDQDSRTVAIGGLLLNSEGEVSSVGVSVQLESIDQMKQAMGSATRSEVRLAHRLLDMAEDYQQAKLNSHRKKGQGQAEADWPYAFATSGQERVRGRTIKHGEQVEIKPKDFDIPMTRTIDVVDERLSTASALLGYHTQRYQAGLETWEDMCEGVQIEDVTAFREAKLAETMVQLDSPRVLMEARGKYAEMASIRQGRSVEEIMMEVGVQPDAMGAEGGGEPEAAGVSRFGSPVTETMLGGGEQAT